MHFKQVSILQLLCETQFSKGQFNNVSIIGEDLVNGSI